MILAAEKGVLRFKENSWAECSTIEAIFNIVHLIFVFFHLFRLYILDKQFKAAESIYLEHNQLDEAIGMYQRLHMWDDALNLAEAKAHPDLDQLKTQHARWLLDTGQEEKAGSLKEAEGTTVSF